MGPKIVNYDLDDKEYSPNKKQILEQVEEGNPIVFRNGLQYIGWLEKLTQLSIDAIEEVVGKEKSDKISDCGFEQLHNILQPDEIIQVNSLVNKRVKILNPNLINIFVNNIIGHKGKYYLANKSMTRFFIPYDILVEHEEKFAEKGGRLHFHGPHHDSWYGVPHNSLNIWVAIGPVRKGNSLTIFPNMHNKYVEPEKDGSEIGGLGFPQELKLEEPWSFEMEPGDILLFDSQHLHGSEINRTNKTRFAISARFSIKKPLHITTDQHWYPSTVVGTPIEPVIRNDYIKAVFSTSKKILDRTGFANYSHEQSLGKDNLTEKDYVSTGGFNNLEGRDGEDMIIDDVDLEDGEILPIDSEMCLLNRGGEYVAISRYCTHENADLTKGYHDGENIYCPWHHLCFDMDSGESPCKKLDPISTYNVSETSDGKLRISTSD